jgi:hypothetical protein
VILVESCTDQRALVDQFEVEEFMNVKTSPIQNKHALVKQIIIDPVFEVHIRHILCEIMRINGVNGLIYVANTDSPDDSISARIAKNEFVPVRPRRTIQYPDDLRDNRPVAAPLLIAISILTYALVHEPRVPIHNKIVVVGASDTGLSFLESLIYVTLIIRRATCISRV